MITTQDLHVLNGKSVELVCFAAFSVNIHLQGETLLTVEGDFEHVSGDTQEKLFTTYPVSHSNLMRLLQCSVESAKVNLDGDLLLSFSNGDCLTVWKRLGYESYRLKIGAAELFG